MIDVRAGISNGGEKETEGGNAVGIDWNGGMWNGGGRIVERHWGNKEMTNNKIEGGRSPKDDGHDTSAISSSISFQIEFRS